ncbi:MAG: SDR family NAD(P)-dependent oxidoreductase [Deltaproteobacteria bacterium]|nr:SDR family NAD(P)-dependent oxidoreductase [Deltaproteobacteria bacterium]
MRVLLLGGTRGIGRAIARELAQRADDVFLLGRSSGDCARSVADLCVTAPAARIASGVCDLDAPETFAAAIGSARAFLGKIDVAIVAAGAFGTQEELEDDFALRDCVLRTNFTNTIHFCESVRPALLEGGGGTLCVLSSVAAVRPRRRIVLYGASKAGLSYYAEGIDHRFRAQGLRTVVVEPGFVRTAMTAGLPEPPFAADPERVARGVLRAIDRRAPLARVPRVWALVAAVLRRVPRVLLRRLDF